METPLEGGGQPQSANGSGDAQAMMPGQTGWPDQPRRMSLVPAPAEEVVYETIMLGGGRFKRRPEGSKHWQYCCEHGRVRSVCKLCNGGSICPHNRIRSQCINCPAPEVLQALRMAEAMALTEESSSNFKHLSGASMSNDVSAGGPRSSKGIAVESSDHVRQSPGAMASAAIASTVQRIHSAEISAGLIRMTDQQQGLVGELHPQELSRQGGRGGW